MSEIPLPPGSIPPQKDEPLPFFKTIDFTARPKWDMSMTFVHEFLRLIGDTPDEEKNERLAREMEKIYGKKDAMDIFELTKKHMNQSIVRSSYRDTSLFHEFEERAKIARGILGTPNWKDPNKIPPPITFSAK